MTTNTIQISTGNFHEFFLFKYPIEIGKSKVIRKRVERKTIQEEEINEQSAINSSSRARNKLKRLTIGNLHNTKERLKFVTLTFKDEIEDIDVANYHFKKFRQRVSYKIGKNLQYIAVPEIQEKRAKRTGKKVWHYHLLTFNLPYLPHRDLVKQWGNRSEIQEVRKELNSVKYLTKYLSKSYREPTLKYKKRYYQAVANQPIHIQNQETAVYHLSLFAGMTPTSDELMKPLISHDGKIIQQVRKLEYVRN